METKNLIPSNRQTRLFLIVFASLVLLLATAYYFFLRTDYAVLYTGLRPADASAVVAELDERAVDYQLRDDGTTILVAADEASAVKLAIVGSDVPLKGLVGFELFNKSDMGLTDFAQKINYQRALQGELSRTIMMMDGVENARVHLALPDRSLFRGNRSEPKAAVTVVAARGKAIHDARVVGIQRLVAAAVPDLALSDVVVLDEVGRVISRSLETDAFLAPEVEERSAVQQYYRARIRAAVANTMPGLKFEVRLLAVPLGGDAAAPVPDGNPRASAPGRGAADRDFQLRVSILTSFGLNPEDQELIRNAVTAAVGLKEETGDSLAFDVESVIASAPSVPAAESLPAATADRTRSVAGEVEGSALWAQSWWLLLAGLIGLMFLFARRSGDAGLAPERREDFVRRIRQQLGPDEEGADAAA
jgi:flagellar M-ring protein FliF